MAIKTRQGSQWVNVYGSSIEVKRNVSIDTSLTKSGWAADAKSVGVQIGDISDLNTAHKNNLVEALNEVALNAGSGAQLAIVTFDATTSKASHTRDQIAEIIANKKILLGISPEGETLTFTAINTYKSIDTVAIFENTKIATNGDAITIFYTIDNEGYFTFNEHYHENLIDKIPNAKVGQIAVIEEVDKQKGYPIKWKAQDLEKADNGIIVVEISSFSDGTTMGLTASIGSQTILNCLDKGQFVYAKFNNEYYPCIGLKSEAVLFYLTEINENTAKGKFLFVDNNLIASYHEEWMGQLDYIQNPVKASVGQVLTVSEVNADNIPVKWIASDIKIPDEYIVPECDFIQLGLPTIEPNQSKVIVEDVENLNTYLSYITDGPVKIKYKYKHNDMETEITSVVSTCTDLTSSSYILTCIEYFSDIIPTIITFLLNETSIEAFAYTINADLLKVVSLPQDISTSTVGQALVIKSIDNNGKIEWKTVDLPAEGSTVIDYTIPHFDLTNFLNPTAAIYQQSTSPVPVDSMIITPDQGSIAVLTDTTALFTALKKGPIKITYKYVLATETITLSTIIIPTYNQLSNSYHAEFIEQFENIPRLVTFDFVNNMIIANAFSLNQELKKYIPIPEQNIEPNQFLQVKSIDNHNNIIWELAHLPQATDSIPGIVKAIQKTDDMNVQVGIDAEGQLWTKETSSIPSNGLPEYNLTDQNKYITVNEKGELIWKDIPIELPIYSSENKNQYLTPNENGELVWQTIPTGIPNYSLENKNQYITINSNGELIWQEIPQEIPTYLSTNVGQYITVNNTGNLEWQDLPLASETTPGLTTIDKTLTKSNKAADAAIVGNNISSLQTSIKNLNTTLSTKIQIITWGESD